MRAHKRDKGRLAGKPQCPTCHTVIDGFTGVGNRAAVPQDGDVSFCVFCGQALVAKGEAWAPLSGPALDRAMADVRVRLAYRAALAYRKEKRQ